VAANAIIFLPDGHVRDPHGRVLVSASGGEPEAEAAVPYLPEARQRKAATESFLEAKGHYALNWLVGFEGAEWDDVETTT
jgi:hypothetical protein